MVYYPTLVGEMAKREIPRKALAQAIGVCEKALRNKMEGKTAFTWPEVKTIRHTFFPDTSIDELFSTINDIPVRQ